MIKLNVMDRTLALTMESPYFSSKSAKHKGVLVLRSVAFILILFTSVAARAEALECERAVTLDKEYAASQKSPVESTDFLNRAFSPFLKSLHNGITQLPIEDIHAAARLFPIPRKRARVLKLEREERSIGFSAAFTGNFFFVAHGIYDFDAPFTEFSAGEMAKLDRALYVTEYLMRKKFHPHNDRTLQESLNLRAEQTFAGADLEKQMYYGYLSVAQAVGALIADPVGNLSAEELMRSLMTQEGRGPSLVVIQSLMLPPQVLGPYGSRVYFKDPLEIKDGKLTFTPAYRAFIKERRDEFFARGNPDACEHGNGCPVGHRLDGIERPGLQYFLDTLMYVYDRMP